MLYQAFSCETEREKERKVLATRDYKMVKYLQREKISQTNP